MHVSVLLGSVWRLYPLRHTHMHKLTILDSIFLFLGISFLWTKWDSGLCCTSFPLCSDCIRWRAHMFWIVSAFICSEMQLSSSTLEAGGLCMKETWVRDWKPHYTTKKRYGEKRQPVIGSFVASKPPILVLILDLKLSGAPFDSQEYKFLLNSCYEMYKNA